MIDAARPPAVSVRFWCGLSHDFLVRRHRSRLPRRNGAVPRISDKGVATMVYDRGELWGGRRGSPTLPDAPMRQRESPDQANLRDASQGLWPLLPVRGIISREEYARQRAAQPGSSSQALR